MSNPTVDRVEIQKLIELGKEKGYLTYEEVNNSLPENVLSSEAIDDMMAHFAEIGIAIVDNSKSAGEVPGNQSAPKPKKSKSSGDSTASKTSKGADYDYGKTNDPVRMYLRKMGSVSLLTREGEVEIAKRIEEGELMVLDVVLGCRTGVREIITLGERL